MSNKKKKGHPGKNKSESRLTRIALATAILGLIKVILEIIQKLIE